jgi:hypothetical protein
METEGSSPHSQEPTTCPYLEPEQSTPYPPPPSNLSKIHFASDPDLYRLLTFHVQSLIFFFHCLGRTEGPV